MWDRLESGRHILLDDSAQGPEDYHSDRSRGSIVELGLGWEKSPIRIGLKRNHSG